MALSAPAAVSWDAEGESNWWFDYFNWSTPDEVTDPPGPGFPLLPPNNNAGDFTDIQINMGSGAWDVTGEGVVFDPDNDPFYTNPDVNESNLVEGGDFLALQQQGKSAANWNRQYGETGYGVEELYYPSGTVTGADETRDYGPQTLYRLYMSRNTTNSNKLTIKSGNILIGSTTIIGRSGGSIGNENLGMIVQEGGYVELPSSTLDLGQSEDSGYGNGIYDYRGGSLYVQSVSGSQGIRVSAGRSSGAGGASKFIMHNPDGGGFVRTFDFTIASTDDGADGVNTGVGTVEFHFENGGTRPIQVQNNLTLNNGADDDTEGSVRSSRLNLVLNEAPSVDGGGVPQDLPLFDVDFESLFGGTINGTGDLNGDMDFANDQIFSSADGLTNYYEGDTVSAVFGGTKYDWTITYTGDISWTDVDNSVVGTVLGAGTGTDVVLIGLGSAPVAAAAGVPEPGAIVLAVSAGLILLGSRRRRTA
ncbi:MAG: hypothetical protein CMJ58_09905 [Planctomycetaceae bacterium]|nr:hypothetical protein [Planctomycetaceae bacterium]